MILIRNICTFICLIVFFALSLSAADAPLPDALWLTYMRHSPTHIVVSWVTKKPEESIVRFGTTEICEMQALLKGVRTLHHVEVPLSKDAPFFYRLKIDGALTEAVRFQGLPSDELRIAMVADWGFANADISAILKDKPHLMVTGGDHIARLHGKGVAGESAKLNLMPHLKLIAKYPELFRKIPFMPVLGNHDREIRPRAPLKDLKAPVYDVDATAYLKIFSLPGDGWKWRLEMPEFGLRLIGLDLNHVRDNGTFLQSCHDHDGSSIQLRWYKEVMTELPRPPFTITLHNTMNSVARNLASGEWLRLMRRGTLVATGYGYYAERADENGFPWYNTALGCNGDVYKDKYSKFLASEHSYLLFTFKRGASKMQTEIKRLGDGKALDTQVFNAR